MSVTKVTKVVKVGDTEVIVRELTVSDVRAWLVSNTNTKEKVDIVDNMLFDDISLEDVKLMSNITDDVIEGLAVSQLRQVVEVCKELNSYFFKLREQLVVLGKAKTAKET